jgi:hypothetical protein
MSNVKYPEIKVQLTGTDGNAFALIGRVAEGLKRAKVPTVEVNQFRHEAMSGDYDNVLRTCMKWVNVG